MPELPRLLPQANIQPGASSPTVGLRNDVGVGVVAGAVQDFATALSNLAVNERVTAALNKASDDHVQYLGELSALEKAHPDPQAFQIESMKLSRKYLSGNDKATLNYFNGDAKALQIYKSHLNPQVESGFAQSVKLATERRFAAAGPQTQATADKLMRDALALGPGSPTFQQHVNMIDEFYTSVDPVLVPNKEVMRQSTFDKLSMGIALQEVRSNPILALDSLHDGSFTMQAISNTRQLTMSPEMKEALVNEAYQQLGRDQHQAAVAKTVEDQIYDRGQKVNAVRVTLGIMRNDPEAFDMVTRGTGLDQHGRPFIEASELRSIQEFKLKRDQERIEGRVTSPEAFGRASTKVRNGQIASSIEIYALKDMDLAAKDKLNAQFLSLHEKLRDHTYQDYHKRLKRGEDHIRAMVKSKNPLSGMGEVDAVADGLVQTYYAEMEQKEAALALTPGATVAGLRPVEHASEFMLKKQEYLATTYEHDADKVTHQMSEFLPAGQPISYPQLFENIEKSKNTKVGKLILKSLAYQMEKQGVTPQQMETILRRNTTKKSTDEGNGLNKLFQGARDRFDNALKWLGTLEPQGE